MTESTFDVSVVSGLAVVSAPSEIDASNCAEFRSALQIAAAGPGPVIADLSRTEYCDSTGLTALVTAYRRAKQAGRELRLVVATSAVQRIIEVTGVDTVLPVYPTLADALRVHSPDGVAASKQPLPRT